MTNIKKFIDRVSHAESRGSLNVNMSIDEARLLRDEMSKLLADMIVLSKQSYTIEPVSIKISGGKW